MQLKWGSYAFSANEVNIQTSASLMVNQGGQPYAIKRRFNVSGHLLGSGQSDLTQKMNALQNALQIPYQDLVFYRDDGSASATLMRNFDSIGGILITDGPNFPGTSGAEYATTRQFNFAAEGEFPLPATQNLLLSFSERLNFSGGGPIYRHRMAVNERPQKQLVYPHSIYRVQQEGEIVGYRRYIDPPPPLWPGALVESPDVSVDTPERKGKTAPAGYQGYRTTWAYRFESAVQLVGVPNLWVN